MENLVYKNAKLEINISPTKPEVFITNATYYSYDVESGRFLIHLKKDQTDFSIPEGTDLRMTLVKLADNSKYILTPEIEDRVKGVISLVIPRILLGYVGGVRAGIFIKPPNTQSVHGGYFTFSMALSDIDDDNEEMVEFYNQLFEDMAVNFEKDVNGLMANAEEHADGKITEYDKKFEEVETKVSSIENQTTMMEKKQDEILEKIEKNDVPTKLESSANVIDQIGGAESTILKKELLVNGTEGMASRFVKDLPYTNIILNGDFKNGITNWSYHQPAGNLSEFVDDVVHAKSNNGTVTGVFQPSDQRLKYGYSTKANEKFFFYALAKGTGIIQLGFDKKRGSATLTQNYTWVGVESTGTTDNEVMTFYTTGEMWIKAIIVSKSEIMNIESFYPAAEDVGVVHGQPNLRNGTSSTLSEVTFIQTQYKETNLVVSNLFKPNDLVTYAVQIDNTAGTADVFAQLACKKSDNTYVSFNGSSVLKGSIGRSMVQVTVLEEYTNIYVKPLVKSNSTISTTVRYGEEKLINGSLEAMDEWTPSQADSGLTPINGGMVPFNEKDYEDLLSDDGIVRAETKIVGRGAEIETPFKIIEVFANRYPDIFGKTTTDAEKITCFKSIQKGVTIKSTLRGSGANASKNGQLYLKYTDGTSEFLVNNQTSEFVEISKTLTATQLDQLSSTGVLTVYATTKRNGTNDAGAISDGVTSALLEVKDLRLIVEIEANGKTIIESIIAANQVESIATGEEAEEGKTDEKLMTPLKTKEFYLNETKARRQKWDEGLNWIAHRGNNTDYPENSILAFQQAKRHWGIETDIQVTSDGKWVVMHDSTVDRTTNGTGTVASKTLAQFRELRIDAGANLSALTDADKIPPTLEEYLLICKQLNKVPVIEIKTGNYTTAHYTLLKDTLSLFGYDETNCVIASFDYVVLGKIRAMYRNMELHYFVSDISSNVINQLSALGIPAACSCSHSNNSLNAENIKLLHAVGLKVAAWTVPEDKFDSLSSLGVDYITTNSLSGNLKFAMLELVNGFVNNLDSGRIRGSYCEEIGGGRCSLDFNVQEAPTINSQGTPFAKLPNWAFPMYRTYENCTIRTSTGVTLGTFDINGRQVPASATVGTLGIGLNWTDRTNWAAGSTTYKV